MKKSIIFAMLLLLAPLSMADTGWWQYTENYKVLMSMAPLAPKVDQQTSFLFSFLEGDDFIKGELKAKLRISMGHDKVVYESSFENVKNGIFSHKYKFDKPGFYEVGVEFIADGKKNFVDFPVEAVEERKSLFIPITMSFIIGMAIGLIAKNKGRKK